MRLAYTDHRADPGAWATALGISREAVELYLASDVIDQHIDSFLWTRIFGYELTERHDHGLFGARFYSQVDFPRILEAQVTGAAWIITTNPAKVPSERLSAFFQNLARLEEIFAGVPEQFARVRTVAEYRAARAAGKHAAFVGVQGGNAFEADPSALERIPQGDVLRVTVVHLSTSGFGATSSPLAFGGGERGLTPAGKDFCKRLQAANIFVDLAHISKRGFWDAVEVTDPSLPLIVTHTGIEGVHRHWRNLDDDQLRAIAQRGGSIGVMYQSSFLGESYWGGTAAKIVDHLEHIVKTVGDEYASLGSDWDGAILPPRDMPTCLELPKLVQIMLDRGWSDERIRRILGGNVLRVIETLRG